MAARKRVATMGSRTKSMLLSRLRTIEGHVRGILRMVEADAYCPEILMQALAVQRAIDRFNYDLLESHLESCFVSAVRGESQADRERALREVLNIFQSSAKLKSLRSFEREAGSDGVLTQQRAEGAREVQPGCPGH